MLSKGFASWLRVLRMVLVLLAAIMLVNCGGGSGGTSNADPTGYYVASGGTATVDDGAGGTLIISDLEGMASSNRILMLSPANKLLYDIHVSSINGNSFNGDAIVYTDGINPINAKVSGSIITGSTITGTLSGAGVGNGNFKITYSKQTTAIPDKYHWGNFVGGSSTTLALYTDIKGGAISNGNTLKDGNFASCTLSGTLSLIGNTELYEVKAAIANCTADTGYIGNYTGFVTIQDATQATIVFAITKDDNTHSVNGDFGT